jgi:hypothetical protein
MQVTVSPREIGGSGSHDWNRVWSRPPGAETASLVLA